MEQSKFEEAKKIKEQLDGLLRLKSFCYNSDTKIHLEKIDSVNDWDSIRLPKNIRDEVIIFIKDAINTKIIELEQQFKEL